MAKPHPKPGQNIGRGPSPKPNLIPGPIHRAPLSKRIEDVWQLDREGSRGWVPSPREVPEFNQLLKKLKEKKEKSP